MYPGAGHQIDNTPQSDAFLGDWFNFIATSHQTAFQQAPRSDSEVRPVVSAESSVVIEESQAWRGICQEWCQSAESGVAMSNAAQSQDNGAGVAEMHEVPEVDMVHVQENNGAPSDEEEEAAEHEIAIAALKQERDQELRDLFADIRSSEAQSGHSTPADVERYTIHSRTSSFIRSISETSDGSWVGDDFLWVDVGTSLGQKEQSNSDAPKTTQSGEQSPGVAPVSL